MEPIVINIKCYELESDSSLRSAQARLFGELVKLATPVVHHYQSDFFHDALWVRKYALCDCEFFFGFRDTGTSIGTDEDLVVPYNEHVYKVSMVLGDGTTTLNIVIEEVK